MPIAKIRFFSFENSSIFIVHSFISSVHFGYAFFIHFIEGNKIGIEVEWEKSTQDLAYCGNKMGIFCRRKKISSS